MSSYFTAATFEGSYFDPDGISLEDTWQFNQEPEPVKSDGGSTSYYDLDPDAKDVLDIINQVGMSFAIGNIFKACFRLGRKSGTTRAYDLRKIIFFAQRELEWEEKRAKQTT